jgi:hypothetical protein
MSAYMREISEGAILQSQHPFGSQSPAVGISHAAIIHERHGYIVSPYTIECVLG